MSPVAKKAKAPPLDYRQTSDSRIIADILGTGLRVKQANQAAQRIIDKGTDIKSNPYVTDADKCPRATGYSLLNEPKSNPDSTESLIAFELGRAAEGLFAEALTLAGCKVHREVRLEIPFLYGPQDAQLASFISGRTDFLVELPALLDSIIELKTINSRSMQWMVKRGEYGKSAHRHQLNLYLEASQRGLVVIDGEEKNWDLGYLTYILKDAVKGEPSIVTWIQHYDAKMAADDIAELTALKEAASLGVLPPRPYERPAWWPCHYCPYEITCWK